MNHDDNENKNNIDDDDDDLKRTDGLLLCEGMVQQGTPKPETASTKQRLFDTKFPNNNNPNSTTASTTQTTTSPEPPQWILPFLAERVYVSEDVLEGIRRALFSELAVTTTALEAGGITDDGHNNIAIMQSLLDMPYLPRQHSSMPVAYYQDSLKLLGTTDTKNITRGGGGGQERIVNMLGEGIALRLLGDVTMDACVKEGEDELLGDLNILDDGTAADGHEQDHDHGHGPPHGKRARRRMNSENKCK